MNMESTAPNHPTNIPPAHDSSGFDIEELGKKDRRWRLEVRPGDLALFEAGDSQPYVILREQMFKDAVFTENVRALMLHKPKKVTLKLTPEATAAVADWIGKPMLASLYLKRRYAWVLPVAIIWVLGSMPVSGNPEAGTPAHPPDLVGLGLGIVLVVAWAFARWRPHSMLFLVDSIWFLFLAGYLANDVIQGRSKLWLLLLPPLLWMVVTGFKSFARFRMTRLTPIQAK